MPFLADERYRWSMMQFTFTIWPTYTLPFTAMTSSWTALTVRHTPCPVDLKNVPQESMYPKAPTDVTIIAPIESLYNPKQGKLIPRWEVMNTPAWYKKVTKKAGNILLISILFLWVLSPPLFRIFSPTIFISFAISETDLLGISFTSIIPTSLPLSMLTKQQTSHVLQGMNLPKMILPFSQGSAFNTSPHALMTQ